MKNKMLYKVIPLCLGVLGAITIAGCNVKENELNEQIFTYNEVTTVKFSWWGNDPRHIYTMEGLEKFEDKYPDIKVSKQYGEWNGFEKRNKVWMKSKTEADVMQINFAWIDQYSKDGMGYYDLYELSDYINLDNYSEADLKLAEVNGHLNAIPIAYNTQMYAVSEDVFSKYGLSIPKTWDDLFKAAEVMSVDEVYPIGMVKKQMFLMLMSYYEQSKGHPFFNEDGSLAATEEEIGELVEFYSELLNKKVIMPIDQFGQEEFAKGNIASSMFWISDTSNYCVKATEQGRSVVICDYPQIDGTRKDGRYIKPATLYAISKNTKNPVEAAKLLDFLLNSTEMAELQGTEKGVPISKSAYTYLESTDKLNSWQTVATEEMIVSMDDMKIMIPEMENENIIDMFKTCTDDYVYEQISLEEAANQIYTQIMEME